MATTQPVTEAAFTEDRKHFLDGFVNFVIAGATGVAILLILLAFFLV
jgi:hypothetical protein